VAPDYDNLTLLQKVEIFEHALDTTQGDDLAKLLWLKSPSSEVWFDRRTNYTRSLAVMSMVGYVLGLGDRCVNLRRASLIILDHVMLSV
jgi:FKBP12-rapamycin complex-associated protein